MEIPQKLRDYLDENRSSHTPVKDPDEPLGIDSLGLIRLVGFMETELGIRIEDDELLAENFESLRSLSALLATKSAGSAAPEASGEAA